MPTENSQPVINWLLNPSSYPHEASEIKLIQTHISYVFLAGDFVYKIKKPVDFGFLDFTTLHKRQHFCQQELILNRRLCPTLYLEVISINRDKEQLSLGGAGTPIEYAVKMVRMAEEKMMGNIINKGQLTSDLVDKIVAILTPFYEKAATSAEISKFGRACAVNINLRENFEQTRPFIGCKALSQQQYDTISQYANEFLTQEKLFEERIAANKIKDCHGDLYSANICIDKQVYIYDCIEFNHRFRYCDVASDVAFLAMDLDFHGLYDLSNHFIECFSKTANDKSLLTMLDFYKCYRAYVRGKINLFTAHAKEVDKTTKTNSLNLARKYFILAARYAASH